MEFKCNTFCYFKLTCHISFVAIDGTLRAEKRKKIVAYTGELLLQGVHDDVDVVLLTDGN